MSNLITDTHTLWINGKRIPYTSLLKSDPEQLSLSGEFEMNTLKLISKWLSGDKVFNLKSSGSTSQPKIINTIRNKLEASAGKTIDILGLKSGLNALLCLNPQFTAGFMFTIRALMGKFRLYATTPASNPLINLPSSLKIDLISLVPSQLFEILKSGCYEKRFNKQSIILLGGGPVSSELGHNIRQLPGKIYQTFGMAETLSHFALRKMNGPDKSSVYETLNGVTIRKDENDCLIVDAPHLSETAIRTKDIVGIIDQQHFIWKGRLDHIIQSGGIKITPEWLEKKIDEIFREQSITENFFLSSIADAKYGEKMVLVVEDKKGILSESRLYNILEGNIGKYEMPKEILLVKKFYYTDTMKTDRKKTMEKIKNRN